MTSTSSIELQAVIAGRYRVLRELGRGGMGAVYLVEHVNTGEQLALKVLLSDHTPSKEAIERFQREARMPAKIKSENVVKVTDADAAPELGGALFMVMEALQGKDLDAVVNERGALAPAVVSWILRQIAGALDKAHSLGIIHRDLKPENLFLHTRDDGTEIVKILDFGISKMRDKDGNNMAGAGLTQTGAVMGTPLYMAPEQARGQVASMGPGADVWALGLVTLRLLTGEVYWTADTLADLLMKVMVEPMPPPSVRFPKLGAAFDEWFARSCDRDVSRRFASVGEQVRAFSLIVDGPIATTQVMPHTLALDGARAPSGSMAQSARALGGTPNPMAGPMLGGTPNPMAGPMLGGTPNPMAGPMLGGTPNPMAAPLAGVTPGGVPAATTDPNARQLPAQTGPNPQPPPRFSSTTGAGAFVQSSPVLEPAPGKPRSGGKIALLVAVALVGVLGVVGAGLLFVVARGRGHGPESAASSAPSAEPPPVLASASSAPPPPAVPATAAADASSKAPVGAPPEASAAGTGETPATSATSASSAARRPSQASPRHAPASTTPSHTTPARPTATATAAPSHTGGTPRFDPLAP